MVIVELRVQASFTVTLRVNPNRGHGFQTSFRPTKAWRHFTLPPPLLCNFEFQPQKENALKQNLSAEDGETEACVGVPRERRACGVYAQEMGGDGGTTSHH